MSNRQITPEILGLHPASAPSRPGMGNGYGALRVAVFLLGGIIGSLTLFSVVTGLDRFGAALGILLVLLGPPSILLLAVASRSIVAGWMTLRQHLAWWHGLWFLAFASALVFRIRDTAETQSVPIDNYAFFRLIPEGIVGFVLVARWIGGRTRWVGGLFRGLVGALTIYALVSLVSAAWSVYPTWTIYKSGEYLLDLALLAAVLATVSSAGMYKSLFDWTWIIYGADLLWVWMGAFIFPDGGVHFPSWRLMGAFPYEGANSVGNTGAMLAVVALARMLPLDGQKAKRALYAFLFLFGTVTLLASQTRHAMAGLALGAVLVLIYSRRVWLGGLVAIAAAPLLLLTHLGESMWTFLQRGQTQGAVESLTGRLDWWSFAWEQLMRHPWTGLGGYAAGRFAVLSELGKGDVASLHSDYIEILVGTSFWGLLPFVGAMIGCWWLLTRYAHDVSLGVQERHLAIEALGVLGVLTVHSFFNTDLIWHAPLFFLVVIGYAEFLRRARWERAAWAKARPAPTPHRNTEPKKFT